jgi:ribosomal protein L27
MARFVASLAALGLTTSFGAVAGAQETLLWQNEEGQVHIWLMRDGERVAGLDIGAPIGREWTLHGLGDLDGDGRDEVVWRNANGQVHAWRVDNQLRPSGFNIYQRVGSSWELKALGDVNGDGTDDIIWQNGEGQVHYWAMGDSRRQEGVDLFLPVLQPGWNLEAAGDFNGDGYDDIVWRLDDGRVHIWQVEDGQVTGANFVYEAVNANWSIAGAGDMDGDGVDDIIWRNAGGALQYWRMGDFERLSGVPFGSRVGAQWTLSGLGSMFDIDDFATGCQSVPLSTALNVLNSGLEALDPTILIDHRNHNVGRQSLNPYTTGQNRFTTNAIPEIGLAALDIPLSDIPAYERPRRIHFVQDLSSNAIRILPGENSDARLRISFETDGNEIKGWFVGSRVGEADGRAADANLLPPRGQPYPYVDVFFNVDYDRSRGANGLVFQLRNVDARMRVDANGVLELFEHRIRPPMLRAIETGVAQGFRSMSPAIAEIGGAQLSQALEIPRVGSVYLTNFRIENDRAELCWDTDF